MRGRSFIHSGGLLAPIAFLILSAMAATLFFSRAKDTSGDEPTRRISTRTRLLLPSRSGFQSRRSPAANRRGNKSENSTGNSRAGGPAADKLQMYAASLLRRIDRAKRFPREEEADGKSAIVSVRMNIGSDGRLKSLRVVAPSAHEAFNRAATRAVQRANPFPPIPVELKRETLSLRVRIRFIARRFNDDE